MAANAILKTKLGPEGFSVRKVITEERANSIARNLEEYASKIKSHSNNSTGMIGAHYCLDALRFGFDRDVYRIATDVIGTDKLVFRDGPERFSIKNPGATQMVTHIDANMFNNEINDPRVQSLCCLQSKNEDGIPNGSLELLVNFHHYWNFASALFDPDNGLIQMPVANTRFHILPKDWDRFWLKNLIHHIVQYTQYLDYLNSYDFSDDEGPEAEWEFSMGYDSESDPESSDLKSNANIIQFYDKLVSDGITVPDTIQEIKWKIIDLEPGSMVFWDIRLPHRSTANKTDTPRIVIYGAYFPIHGPEWYSTPEAARLKTMVTKCHSYRNSFQPREERSDTKIDNWEEHNYIRNNPGLLQEIQSIITETQLSRRLVGLESYHWK